MFVSGKLFQPSIVFAAKAREYLSKLLALPTTIRLGWKGFQGQTL
jgi:hypothetical protein